MGTPDKDYMAHHTTKAERRERAQRYQLQRWFDKSGVVAHWTKRGADKAEWLDIAIRRFGLDQSYPLMQWAEQAAEWCDAGYTAAA